MTTPPPPQPPASPLPPSPLPPEIEHVEHVTIPEKLRLLMVMIPTMVAYCFGLTTCTFRITEQSQLWAILGVAVLIGWAATATVCEQIAYRKDFRLIYADCIPAVDVRIYFWKTTFSFTLLYMATILPLW
jgi:hypothetical protein